MSSRGTAFVIAVSGVSGAGKTSVIKRTVALLGDAVALHFDDYATVSSYPPNLEERARQGPNVDEWKTPRLASDLRALRSGQSISLPEDRGILQPAGFIV